MIGDLIRRLYAVRDALRSEAADRGYSLGFTLTGKLAGDIGELHAAEEYGLHLLNPGAPIHDSLAPDGRRVQEKTTQANGGIEIDSEPEHLLVLLLKPDGSCDEIYNGPGVGPWSAANQPNKKGYRFISHGKLVRLNAAVMPEQRLPRLQRD